MRYMVTVNGRQYDIMVQPVDALAGQASAFVPAPQPAPAPMAAPAPAAAVHTGNVEVVSPMPGSVWQLNCSVGDVVAEGQTLLVLEAMKMENDIVAPQAGTVKQVLVSKGTTVETNDVLVVLS